MLSLWLLKHALKKYLTFEPSKQWPCFQGKILSSQMVGPDAISQCRFLAVEYDYQINGGTFCNDKVSLYTLIGLEVKAQVAFADRIIINKADLITESEQHGLKKRLQEINQMAGFYSATMADTRAAGYWWFLILNVP